MVQRYFLRLVFALGCCGCYGTGEQMTATPFVAKHQNDFVAPEAKLELLWGKGVFTEGPAIAADGSVLFSDIPADAIMKSAYGSGKISVYRQGSGKSNGLTFTPEYDLLMCESGSRRITKLSADGQLTVLADNYQGKKLNSPNDIAYGGNGDIYFTDPRYGKRDDMELDFEGVYLIRQGKLSLASKELERPNGILISIDGKYVYVADNNPEGRRALFRFEVKKDGSLVNRKTLYVFEGDSRGIDGMDMDTEGNIYATAGKSEAAGIYIFSAAGEHLAKLSLPDTPTNCRFGGIKEPNTLYITCQVERQPSQNKAFGLYRVKLKKEGFRLKP